MNEKILQILSIAMIAVMFAFILWVYSRQPQNFQEVVSKAAVTAGTYGIDDTEFKRGIELFRQDNFTGARESFAKADPERRDAKVQFYTAYSFYRQGFGKLYDDDKLFQQGMAATDHVIALDTGLRIDDDNLQMKTPQELKAELQDGLQVTADDFNPLKHLRERK
jgi:hypothetical protein